MIITIISKNIYTTEKKGTVDITRWLFTIYICTFTTTTEEQRYLIRYAFVLLFEHPSITFHLHIHSFRHANDHPSFLYKGITNSEYSYGYVITNCAALNLELGNKEQCIVSIY